MAHCEIKSINDSKRKTKSTSENLPREGIVNEVCREWLLHEDQALAYRLQSEEYQHHLGHNRHRNALLRKDTPRAREEQLKEDEEAARAQMQIEMDLAKQEARDAAVAAAVGEDLDRQEREKRKLQEMKDFEMAKQLIDEEKAKIRQMKELRRSQRPEEEEEEEITYNRAASPGSEDLSDLSDFCIKPTSSMDEEEMRSLQENQDEELAQLMQEQDLKRRGDLLQEDQLLAIEAQDKELAKVLQEQERAKAKKAREKARQKALLKRQQQKDPKNERPEEQQRHLEDVEKSTTPPRPPKVVIPPSGESPQYASIVTTASPHSPYERRPNSPQYATPMLVTRTTNSSSSPLKGREAERSYPEEPYQSPSAFPNIACAIDPTYQRRVRLGELSPSPTLPPPNHSSPSPGPSSASISPPPVPVFDEDEDEYLPPPYMPMQGQRRISSLEKSKGGREKDKNACKQQ